MFSQATEEAITIATDDHIVWAESPLQLLGAVEHLAQLGAVAQLAYRLTGPQMTSTVEELLRRGAPFVDPEPYLGVPWSRLQQHRRWIVGDAFSGQVRAALAVRPPQQLTLVDDGHMTVHFARAVLGEVGYGRLGQREGAVMRALGVITHARLLDLARESRLTLRTVFGSSSAVRRLAQIGVPILRHEFAWLRANAVPVPLPCERVILGTALVTDGHRSRDQHMEWLTTQVRHGAVAYLPHRRERREDLERIASVPGVTVVRTGLPVELVLAGTDRELDIVAVRSSATQTLRILLGHTGSRVRETHRDLHWA